MHTPDIQLDRLARTLGFLLLGVVGTAVLAVGLLAVTQPLQEPIYDAFYLAVGPWTATTAATVITYTLASLAAAGLTVFIAAYGRSRFEHIRELGGLLGGLLLLATLLLVAAAYTGTVGLLAAMVAVAAFVVGVPVGERLLGVWPDGIVAFAGAVPVLVALLFLLGFGLGWGGGYDVVAREVPASAANESIDADFADAPALRDDLLAPTPDDDVFASCEQDDAGRRTCRLSLRGYDDEAAAARFLDRHGVRCPFLNNQNPGDGAGNRSFVAADDGTFYRVTCVAYGD